MRKECGSPVARGVMTRGMAVRWMGRGASGRAILSSSTGPREVDNEAGSRHCHNGAREGQEWRIKLRAGGLPGRGIWAWLRWLAPSSECQGGAYVLICPPIPASQTGYDMFTVCDEQFASHYHGRVGTSSAAVSNRAARAAAASELERWVGGCNTSDVDEGDGPGSGTEETGGVPESCPIATASHVLVIRPHAQT